VARAATDRRFATFARLRAAVLWPYDMDLVSFYELYAMGSPLWMPRNLEKYVFQQHHRKYDYIMPGRGNITLWPHERSPFAENSLETVRGVLAFVDYFRFPHVQYFDTTIELLIALLETDLVGISAAMRAYNDLTLVEVVNFWTEAARKCIIGLDR
jgi:hypothetical protein